jgi:hypothetical protein
LAVDDRRHFSIAAAEIEADAAAVEVPAELGSFKFARQKSKLAGTIRGSYFVIKGEY